MRMMYHDIKVHKFVKENKNNYYTSDVVKNTFTLSKIHNFFGIGVNGDCASHRTRSSVLGATALVRSFARIVLLFDQMIPGSECHQVGVVSWRGN